MEVERATGATDEQICEAFGRSFNSRKIWETGTLKEREIWFNQKFSDDWPVTKNQAFTWFASLLIPPDTRIVAVSDLRRLIRLATDSDNVADDQREFLERMREACD